MHLQYKCFAFFALAIYFFFIFGTGNANLFYFRHWKYIFFKFLALGMQISFIFCIGNANLFYFSHWECNFFFVFSIDKNDTIFKTFLPFKCMKWTISFCNLYLPPKHPLALDFGQPKKVWKFSKFSISLGQGGGV